MDHRVPVCSIERTAQDHEIAQRQTAHDCEGLVPNDRAPYFCLKRTIFTWRIWTDDGLHGEQTPVCLYDGVRKRGLLPGRAMSGTIKNISGHIRRSQSHDQRNQSHNRRDQKYIRRNHE